jgi:hypothetical protein
MPKQLLKAAEAVRLAISWVCLVLPVLELLPTVGADKALWVELVSHGGDDSALDHLGAHKTSVLRSGTI